MSRMTLSCLTWSSDGREVLNPYTTKAMFSAHGTDNTHMQKPSKWIFEMLRPMAVSSFIFAVATSVT